MSLFISPHVNHHNHPPASPSATDSLVARVHTQLYRSIESNRKICRLQLGRLSIRKTTETMKPKSSPSPLQDERLGLGRSKVERTGGVVSSSGSGTSGGSAVAGSDPEVLTKPGTGTGHRDAVHSGVFF